jgi:hypothetical protein
MSTSMRDTSTQGALYEFQAFFFFLLSFLSCRKLSIMSSGSLPFQLTQNFTGMPFDGTYNISNVSHSPSLSADLSFPSGISVSGPTTPLDGSLLSPAHILYSTASGGPGSINSSAYTHLLCQNQLLECELSKERQEHMSLKYVPCILTSYHSSCWCTQTLISKTTRVEQPAQRGGYPVYQEAMPRQLEHGCTGHKHPSIPWDAAPILAIRLSPHEILDQGGVECLQHYKKGLHLRQS